MKAQWMASIAGFAGIWMAWNSAASTSHGSGGQDVIPVETNLVTRFTPFLDPLPIPANAVPVGMTNGSLLYEIPMSTVTNWFHTNLPPVEVWGYAGTYPGPTLQATNGQPIYVRWVNRLPATYPPWLPVDPLNHGVTNNEVRNVVHLHGGANRPEYDGHPTNTFKPGESRLYLYENIDFTGDGETLWYHDHALGVTANNVYAGLAGFYLLRDPDTENPLQLPKAPYEVPLVFQDRDLLLSHGTNASLYFPTNRSWYHLPVVNGKVAPFLAVEARRYRFRMLNGCVFRTIGLALAAVTEGATNPVPMYQIGTDDGFLTNTVIIPPPPSGSGPGTLRLMPGERADVIVDFSGYAGQTNLVLLNQMARDNAASPPSEPFNVVGGQFMQFRVHDGPPPDDPSRLPTNGLVSRISASELAQGSVRTRTITLDLANELARQTNQPPVSVGKAFDDDPHLFALLNMSRFSEAVKETPTGGDIEVWEFVNLSPFPHPMHVHLVDFLFLNRQNLKGAPTQSPPGTNPPPPGVVAYIQDRNNRQLKGLTNYLDSQVRFTQPNEGGPKDVIHVAPWAVTRIVMQWPDDPRFAGPYVYHCHILDHEDNDMMRPLEVLLPPGRLGSVYDPIDRSAVVKLGTAVGVSYQLEDSDDLRTWRPRATVVGSGLPAIFREPVDAGSAGRFYRGVTP